MTPGDLFQEGRLDEAVTAATALVQSKPADPGARLLLCELLCFQAQWERIDKQLNALQSTDPQTAAGVALFRQLLRAAEARQQLFTDGRVPEFLDVPTGHLKDRLEGFVHLRDGDTARANELLGAAEDERPAAPGKCGDEPFSDFRDCDDVTAFGFEVLTSTGKYYWIPIDRVDVVEFRAPKRPRDLLWRQAHMVVRGGPDGEVYVPALYPGAHEQADQALRLGRATDWRGGENEPVRGIGQRLFLVGEEPKSIMELESLSFGDGA